LLVITGSCTSVNASKWSFKYQNLYVLLRGKPEHEIQKRTDRKRQAEMGINRKEMDRHNRTSRAGQAEQDRKHRTGRSGQAELDRRNWTGGIGQAENRQEETERQNSCEDRAVTISNPG
jgi:hypothetical protein